MKKIYLVYPKKIGNIAPEIYGHFSEHIGGVIYDGLWVGKDSDIPNINGFRKELVEKLKAINPAVIRWPGGCFAETYDWRDGIGENRPIRHNWWKYADGKYETNEVGTHEFLELCEIVGAKPYFAANITTASPLHIRNWMDYCMSPQGSTTLALEREKNGHPKPYNIPYWGVGNENWGDGGNMRPEHYADEFRKFSTLMSFMGRGFEEKVELFACGSNDFDYGWTQGVMPVIANSRQYVDGYAIHYYCGGTDNPIDFSDEEWDIMIERAHKMEEIIMRNWNIICSYGMQEKCKLVVDEWGCWHPVGFGPSKGANLFEQQSTMRDAMVTAITLNIFNNHCDKVKMANVAQLVNNLHCLFLASGEKCITTPTYHIFNMFKEHQGAEAIETVITDNSILREGISASASVKNGKTLLTICNLSCKEDAEVSLEGVGFDIPATAKMEILTHSDLCAHNTFENPENVTVNEISADITNGIIVPKGSVIAIKF